MNYVPGDLRDQLAHVGYDVVQAGLVCGSGGNLSARIPDEDACWVTASGAWLTDSAGRPSHRYRSPTAHPRPSERFRPHA